MLKVPQNVLDALVAPSRFIKAQVYIEINGTTVDVTNDFIALDTAEEVTNSNNDIPYGGVSSNQCTLTLDNISKKWLLDNEAGPYYGNLVSGLPVTINYMIQLKDKTWYTFPKLMFYTDTWKASTNSGTATVICLDYLSLFANKEVPEFKLKKDITFYAAYKFLFESLGIPASKYKISDKLKLPMRYFWNTGEIFQKQLQTLSLAALANVFVDKSEVIQVVSLLDPSVSQWNVTDSELLYNLDSTPTFDSIYSAVRVTYNKIQNTEITEVYTQKDITLTPGMNILNNLSFSDQTISKIISANLTAGKNLSITKLEYSNKAARIQIYNGESTSQIVSLSIYGEKLNLSEEVLRFDNRKAKADNILEIKTNYILSTSLLAIFAKRLLANYSGLVKEITLNVRAMPILDTYDRITLTSPSSNIQKEYRIKQIESTLEDGHTGTITVTVPTDKSASQHVFVGAGLVIGI